MKFEELTKEDQEFWVMEKTILLIEEFLSNPSSCSFIKNLDVVKAYLKQVQHPDCACGSCLSEDFWINLPIINDHEVILAFKEEALKQCQKETF